MLKKVGLWLVVVLCSLNLSGCVFLLIPLGIGVIGGAAIGVGTAKWMSDKLVEQVPDPYAKTIDAVRHGLKDAQIGIDKETATEKLTQFSGKYADGRTVWVNVAYVSDKVTRIEVRVGAWGGKDEARKILDGILARL